VNTKDKKRVAVLFGGRSSEHEISIITALQLIEAMDTLVYDVIPVYICQLGKWWTGNALLDSKFYLHFAAQKNRIQEVTLLPDPSIGGLTHVAKSWDVIPVDVYMLAFHGQQGEDGCVQGLLEIAGAKYTGGGVLNSALSMDKYLCKLSLKEHGIPVLPSTVVSHSQVLADIDTVVQGILYTEGLESFPLFVKPRHLGSSIGISRADDRASLIAALMHVFKYDSEAIVEVCIEDLMEINVSILDGNPPTVSVLEVPVASDKALSYEDKYLREGGKKSDPSSQGMANLCREIDPKDLNPEIKKAIKELSLEAFRILKCSGLIRFDFIYNLRNDRLYFNEANLIPGSFSYYLWEKCSPPVLYPEIIHRLIESAEKREKQKLARTSSYGFKALSL
jgi:D-alanine-D-alanine ligase